MKNLMKMAVTFCLCLILWEGYGQSNLPSNDNIIENEFVCFSYDGGIYSIFTPNLMDLHAPAPKHVIKRSSMEDIMFENMSTNGETVYSKIKEEDPETKATLAKK